jgi:hypothetical protein
VQLVEPAEKREEFKPKGILKKPREVPFPEDPNPTREGVAPLKDAQKDGIPPNARWTKISRALVNPEALEKAHLRYEERDDYVIILRVVSREEIMKLAEKTKEIRGMYLCRPASMINTDRHYQKPESASGRLNWQRSAVAERNEESTATKAPMAIPTMTGDQ